MLRPRARRRPRYPLPAQRWLRYFGVYPAAEGLSLAERHHIAGLLGTWFQEPLPFVEDPTYEDAPIVTMPGFRPAPGHRWAPTETPFALCWPQYTDDDAWETAFDEAHDEMEWPLPDEPPRIERATADGAVVLRLWGSGLRLCADRIELLHGFDGSGGYEDGVDDDDLMHAVAGLTDWTIVDNRQQRALEPVTCASCGEAYLLSASERTCPACDHDRVWVTGPEAPAPPPADASLRLVALLVEAGWIVLAGRADVVADAIDGVSDADAAIKVLMCSPAVEEVYASEAWLRVLLEMW